MDTQKILCSLLCCFLISSILSGQQAVQAGHHDNVPSNIRPLKLFVFGDSYADTGNTNKTQVAWKYPYGITFPGKAVGRFSDGRVLSDYVAKFLGVESPIPYEGWKSSSRGIPLLKYGMNFAYGGTGVFDTVLPGPKMTVQIDFLEHLLRDNVFTGKDLERSVSFVSFAGKDYFTYIVTNGSAEGLQSFIRTVVNQLAINLKRIHGLGVKKIGVTGIVPFGCLPVFTGTSSLQQCNENYNSFLGFHNVLLKQTVEKLNKETKDSPFFIFDLYASFTSAIKNEGSIKFENPLKPCCLGTSAVSREILLCGRVDENGAKLYTLCENPKSSFFWDVAHPSQEGWRAVYSALQATLEQDFLQY
ncbi:GDSL esterase/lipase At5g03610-like [Juglans regia]|uniref:GDSL esterase/lipase At5g03610-like n=2 Tax=Juglans regia TaxID=51240 RepID=A0A2I4DVK8_JUGRE|nr:GDSL esterase/lipase At5g03610-like [Juglans regia]